MKSRTRRRAGRASSALAGLLLASSTLVTACGSDDDDAQSRGLEPALAARANLLLITIDTLRADHLSGYGYHRATSPQIDEFLDSAVTFEAYYANTSWTLGSLASYFTSTYMVTHGCERFDSTLDNSFITLAEILRDHGYRTAGIGSHVFLGEEYGLQQGFDEFDDALVFEFARAMESHTAVTSPAVSDKAIQWLQQEARYESGAEPWFLWVHYFDPHSVYQIHDESASRFGKARAIDRYDGEIAFTDRHVGRLLTALEVLELAGETVVVLTADHGEEFAEHDQTEHGKSVFEEILHVPLAIRVPGLEPSRVRTAAQGVDLLPTVLELLEVAAPPHLEGRSLVSALSGGALEPVPIVGESSTIDGYSFSGLTKGRWKLVHDRSGGLVWAEDGRLRLKSMEAPASNQSRYVLIDRETDPAELHDVSAAHPQIVQSMREELTVILERARSRRRSRVIQREQDDIANLRNLGYVE